MLCPTSPRNFSTSKSTERETRSIELQEPFFISSRLIPSVRVGETVIGIDYAKICPDKRVQYRYYIDFPDGTEHVGEDLRSGCNGGSLKEGMESLLSFLSACGESSNPRHGGDGDNADLFPPRVAEWCYLNDDEIGSVRLWIEESKECCVETH